MFLYNYACLRFGNKPYVQETPASVLNSPLRTESSTLTQKGHYTKRHKSYASAARNHLRPQLNPPFNLSNMLSFPLRPRSKVRKIRIECSVTLRRLLRPCDSLKHWTPCSDELRLYLRDSHTPTASSTGTYLKATAKEKSLTQT
jgi:hypothetical protein